MKPEIAAFIIIVTFLLPLLTIAFFYLWIVPNAKMQAKIAEIKSAFASVYACYEALDNPFALNTLEERYFEFRSAHRKADALLLEYRFLIDRMSAKRWGIKVTGLEPWFGIRTTTDVIRHHLNDVANDAQRIMEKVLTN